MNTQTHPQPLAEVNDLPASQAGQPLTPGNKPGDQHGTAAAIHNLHSLETEAAAVECLLLDPPAGFEALEQAAISPRHFHHPEYRKLIHTAMDLRKSGQPVSVQTVLAQARRLALDPLVLAAVENHLNHPRHIRPGDLPYHLARLNDLQVRRDLVEFSRRAQTVALDFNAPVHNMLLDAFDEFRRVVDRADPEPITVVSATEAAAADVPENDNLLGDRLLAKGQSLTITGAGGVGKSRLLLQLAACCITGRPFLGLPTRGADGTWLILQAENSPLRLKHDLQSLQRWLGEDDWRKISNRLYIHTLAKSADHFLQLDDPAAACRIRAWIDKLRPDVVCFDPLNCFVGGDLNTDRDMRQFCTEATRLVKTGNADRAIIVLHHARTGKAGAAQATGYDRSGFARNSKVLYNWTRGQINIAPRDPEDNQKLVVACGKCSNGREFKTFAITLDQETMTYQPDTQFNLQQWEETMQNPGSRAHSDPVDTLLEICATPCTRLEARKKLEAIGFSKGYTYKMISRALEEKLLLCKNDLLTLPQDDPED